MAIVYTIFTVLALSVILTLVLIVIAENEAEFLRLYGVSLVYSIAMSVVVMLLM